MVNPSFYEGPVSEGLCKRIHQIWNIFLYQGSLKPFPIVHTEIFFQDQKRVFETEFQLKRKLNLSA